VAVGAEQPQVLAPVVAPVPVDVIDLQGHGLAEPLGADAAVRTLFGDADFAQSTAQQVGPRSALAVVLYTPA
jgi:hypothetical protein